MPSFPGSLSFSPDTPVLKGLVNVSCQYTSGEKVYFSQVKLNGRIVRVLCPPGGSPISSFVLDTATFPDGPGFLTLEVVNDKGDIATRPYFIIIGNQADYTGLLQETRVLCQGKQYEKAHELLWEKTGVSGEEKELLTLAGRICADTEKNDLVPTRYEPDRKTLLLLSSLSRYPIPAVPFSANRILAFLSEREGRYPQANQYWEKNLKAYPDLFTLEAIQEYHNTLTGIEDNRTVKNASRQLKSILEKHSEGTGSARCLSPVPPVIPADLSPRLVSGDSKPESTVSSVRHFGDCPSFPSLEKGTVPFLARAEYILGLLEKDSGNLQKARETFTQLSGQSEDSAVSLWAKYQLAVLDKEQKEYEKSLPVFQSLLGEGRERISDYAKFQLGECYFGKRDFRQALPYYERVSLTFAPIPERPFALLQAGVCCLELKEYEKAREFFQFLLKDYPEHKTTRKGMYLLAESIYRDAREKHWGTNPSLELEELTKYLKKVIEKYPDTKEAEDSYYLISQAIREVTDTYNERNQYDLAKRTYSQLVGEEAVGLKQETRTETEPKKGKPKESGLTEEKNPIIKQYLQLADSLYNQRKYQEAIRMYERILAESPRSSYCPWAQFQLGICCAGLREYGKAVEELLKVTEKYPQSPYADDALERAGTYLTGALEDIEGGIKIYQRIGQEYPESENACLAQYLIGVAYMNLENWKEATDAFRQVIRGYPGTDLAARAKDKIQKIAKRQREKGKEG